MFEKADWIKTREDYGDICPIFIKEFECAETVEKAVLNITAAGVYEARLNGERVGDFVMAPGWTSYEYRHLYQTYDVADLIKDKNILAVTVGKGWYRGRLTEYGFKDTYGGVSALIAQLDISYTGGKAESIVTHTDWEESKSGILFSEIYDGEVYDAGYEARERRNVYKYHFTKNLLTQQESEYVTEHERIKPIAVLKTPNGETVIDFGQNLTGYAEFSVNAKKGDVISYSHAEVLDKDGNFYTGNLRSAKQHIKYICRDGVQTYKPHHTFMGFRYIRIEKMPKSMNPADFTAIAVHTDMKRIGHFSCSDEKINKLYSNVIWGQKSNFLDIPTDCPQRDERLGWTGDAQVFVKTASYNFDVQRFFKKWLRDLKAEQLPNGSVPFTVPNTLGDGCSAGWGDAAVICPWQIYLTYGDKEVLEEQIESMTAWVEYMRGAGVDEYLWTGDWHFGDWLGLDAAKGEYKGASRDDFIASAYYAYSTGLLVKTLKVLELDSLKYEELYENIVKAFRNRFAEYETQTECALALCFGLAEDRKKTAKRLAELIHSAEDSLQTGFIGTLYLLDALSKNGYAELAYTLLLREEYPSWLFSVNMGATTMWEHWDGMRADGSFWSDNMNSFNHYAYGAVASWLYETVAGINVDEAAPGFEHIILKPIADRRLDMAEASVDTRFGTIRSKWYKSGNDICYEFDIPKPATFILGGKSIELEPGKHKLKNFSSVT